MTLAEKFNHNFENGIFSLYDSNGNQIYYEHSDGFWVKREFDSNGNEIYATNSSGTWCKYEYDSNGNEIYFENSKGYWCKEEFDSNGKSIYYENSDCGVFYDNRPTTSCNGKIVEIDGKKYQLKGV